MTKTTQYKNTPIGPIPMDWEVKKLGENIDVYRGGSPRPIQNFITTNKNGVNWIKIGDTSLSGKFIQSAKEKIIPEGEKRSRKVFSGDFLLSNSMSFGRPYILQIDGCIHDGWLVLQNYKDTFDKDFLYYILSSEVIINQYKSKAAGSSVLNLNKELVSSVKLIVPPLPEQQKIAEVLSTWDKAIQDTDTIIKKLQDRNKALATSLLTGESRIEAFKNSPSAKLEIKDVAKEISLKNKENHNYTVFSCTKYNGLVPSLEYFGKKIYSDNLKTYKIIKRNQFAYATNHIEEGSMGILEKEDIGLISPMYTIFEFNENVNLDYIFKMLKSDFYINEYKRRMEGSIDRRGGLRWSAFAQIKINLPSIEEQNAIAEILNTANQEVKQYQQKLEALKLQKKGLMQQLLTGKVRTV